LCIIDYDALIPGIHPFEAAVDVPETKAPPSKAAPAINPIGGGINIAIIPTPTTDDPTDNQSAHPHFFFGVFVICARAVKFVAYVVNN
jgi:hypothetical protein